MTVRIFTQNVFLTLFSAIFFLLLGYAYVKHVLQGDFMLFAQVSCDTRISSCFVPECGEGETCTPFAIIYMQARYAPECEPHHCPELTCPANVSYCLRVECSKETQAIYGITETCSGAA